jgi:hypothetical protein
MVRVIVFLALMLSSVGAETHDRPHLEPVGPNFNTFAAPYAKTYARLCEEMLFVRSNWVIRYHEISESAETGVSITQKQDGTFWVTAKQARPSLGPAVRSVFDQNLNLRSALKAVKITERNAEIPERVVRAIRQHWVSLLGDVRPDKRPISSIIISSVVMLYAKTPGGKTLAGKLPYDAYKYTDIYAVEDIAWDLVDICVQPRESHKKLFDRIEKRVRESTH